MVHECIALLPCMATEEVVPCFRLYVFIAIYATHIGSRMVLKEKVKERESKKRKIPNYNNFCDIFRELDGCQNTLFFLFDYSLQDETMYYQLQTNFDHFVCISFNEEKSATFYY
jgi:hypothetical protein